MPEWPILLAIIATFFLACAVKGVIGLGLPTVSLGLMTAVLGLPQAMALMVAPSIVTNLWQAVVGAHFWSNLRRLWPFLLAATVTVWLGGMVLVRADSRIMSGALGLLIMTYGLLNLAGVRFMLGDRGGRPLGVAVGAINGVLTGMTGSFVVPGVMYLQALGLSRDALVQAMGMLFLLSTIAIGVSLQGHGLMTRNLGLLSAAAVIPAILGMVVGTRFRQRLSEQQFRRVFFVSLVLLGGYIAVRAVI